jgi:hypothetical protein
MGLGIQLNLAGNMHHWLTGFDQADDRLDFFGENSHQAPWGHTIHS